MFIIFEQFCFFIIFEQLKFVIIEYKDMISIRNLLGIIEKY